MYSVGDSPSLPPELAAGLAELLAPPDDEPGSPARSAHSPNRGLSGFGGSSRSGMQPFDTACLSSTTGSAAGGSGLGSTWSAAAAAAAAAVPLPPAGGSGAAGLAPASMHGTHSLPVPLAVPQLALPALAPAPAQPHQGSPPAKDGRLRRIFQMKTAGPALLAETLAAQDTLPPPKQRSLLRGSKTETPAVLSGLLTPM